MTDLPAQLREILRPLLPERAFLRRARGDATFITNAPMFAELSLESHGFLCSHQGTLLTLSPGAQFITEFELNHPSPPDFLCRTLLRFRGQTPCEDAITLFAVGVRLLEHADANEARLYDRRVRNLAAVCLRKNLGGAYACALLAHQILKGESL